MTETTVATLPLFPLNTVLFPGGMLPLRVFEARYMDMVRAAMRDESAFGVVLIRKGREAADFAVETEEVGCRARIRSWDMEQLGVLEIATVGTGRFRIVEREVRGDDQSVADLEDEPAVGVPASASRHATLLRRIVERFDEDPEETAIPIAQPRRFDDATWVGNRLAELLPIPLPAKQRLMALTDPLMRLAILGRLLDERDGDEPDEPDEDDEA
jgi:Lon protease-like protein